MNAIPPKLRNQESGEIVKAVIFAAIIAAGILIFLGFLCYLWMGYEWEKNNPYYQESVIKSEQNHANSN